MGQLLMPDDFNTPPVDLSMGIPIGAGAPQIMTEEQFLEMINPTFEIKIKYLKGVPQLQKIEQGDWIDLYTYEEVELHAGEHQYISLGVAMELPEGFEAIVAPRSSTFKKWGILQTNSIGIIDNSYCGDDDIWMLSAYATRDITIPAHTRLCQFRIQQKQPKIKFTSVISLGNKQRGGFGSTGV